jgi:hypothetical protein
VNDLVIEQPPGIAVGRDLLCVYENEPTDKPLRVRGVWNSQDLSPAKEFEPLGNCYISWWDGAAWVQQIYDSGNVSLLNLMTGQRMSIVGVGLKPDDSMSTTRDGERAVVRRINGQWEIWNLKDAVLIKAFGKDDRAIGVSLSIDGRTCHAFHEGSVISVWNVDTGEKIATLAPPGGDQYCLYYDDVCHDFLVWTNEGRVLKYRRGTEFFGNPNWFLPSVR